VPRVFGRPEDPTMNSTMFRTMPLMFIPLVVFSLFALTIGDGWTTSGFLTFNLYSGAQWTFTYGDLFVLFSLLILFVEIVKSVNTEANEILNHGLSVMVALACVVLFVVGSAFGNTAFFLLTVMAFVDVIAGFVITIMTARRDFGGAH
jgi:hypothetical protein